MYYNDKYKIDNNNKKIKKKPYLGQNNENGKISR